MQVWSSLVIKSRDWQPESYTAARREKNPVYLLRILYCSVYYNRYYIAFFLSCEKKMSIFINCMGKVVFFS